MFFKHDLAFRTHAPRLIPLILITIASIIFVCYYILTDLEFWSCKIIDSKIEKPFCKELDNYYLENW